MKEMTLIRCSVDDLVRGAAFCGCIPNGDVDYYFNLEGGEIGYYAIPLNIAVKHDGRKWAPETFDRLVITKLN
jgi:hypothetical protein